MDGDGERLPGDAAVGEAGGALAGATGNMAISGPDKATMAAAALRTALVADPVDALLASGQPARGQSSEVPPTAVGDVGVAWPEGPWRLLIVAFGWMLVVHLCVFLPIYFASTFVGFVTGFTAAVHHVKPDYKIALSPYVNVGAMVFGQTVLLWAALERGTLMSRFGWNGGGRPMDGSGLAGGRHIVLGNLPIQHWPLLVACAIVCIAYQGLVIVWFSRSGIQHGTVPVGENVIQQALIFLVLVVIAPLGEELLFRGWLWTGLRYYWPPLAVTCATAMLWAGAHLLSGLWNVAVLLLFGLILGVARTWTQSVRATILLHMVFNLSALYLSPVLVWLGLL